LTISMDSSDSGFYRAFEERYRGSREAIKQRIGVYLPFVVPLLALYTPARAVDLGCGRGEWLELLQEEGFLPHGVDLDEHMLSACVERGLPAHPGEAVAYLRTLDAASQCVVSGFHIAEHMAFADLQTLVVEALRVLKPGGLLILETPNPENLKVGTHTFYLDPTHLRPIPPLLLSFLPELYDYARTRILRLHASFDLESPHDIQLIEVLEGVSRDYAVVAQKGADSETLALFDAAFDQPYGVEQNDLACRYDQRIFEGMEALNQRMTNAEAQTRAMSDALSCITSLQEQLRHAEIRASTLALEKTALLSSLSWRITGPLRWVGGLPLPRAFAGRRLANGLLHRASPVFQRPLAAAMRFVLRHSALSHALNQRLMRYPTLYRQLVAIARRYGATPKGPLPISVSGTQRFGSAQMTPRAQQIYLDLKAAMAARHGEKG
jgi:SAM-dependent methyltransferase